jgi:hypothetical protein
MAFQSEISMITAATGFKTGSPELKKTINIINLENSYS